MTEKEKAKELYEKYLGQTHYAIICIDELIKAFKNFSIQQHGSVHIDYGHGFWEGVKREIRKF